MKQSVDLMNSMKRFSFRHSNTGTYSTRRTYSTAPTSLARRVMLLLSVLLMSVGSAWAGTFDESTGVKRQFYLGANKTSPIAVNMLDYVSSAQLLEDLKTASGNSSLTLADLNKKLFLKLVIEESDGTECELDQYGNYYITGPWQIANSKYTYTNKAMYTFFWYNEKTSDDFTSTSVQEAYLNFTINFVNTGWGEDSSKTLESIGKAGRKFVFYAALYDNTSDITNDAAWPYYKFNNEPSSLLLRYEFLPQKKEDSFAGKLKTSPEGQALSGGAVVGKADQLTTSATNATLDFSAALAEASSSTYVRFYLEKDGEAVDPTGKLTVTGGTTGPEKEHGFYIYKSGGLSSTDVDNDVTLELTAGEYEDYQVVAVFGYGEPSGDPLHEVDWDLQYKYAFEYPFKGDASSATEVEKAITMLSSD